jgi:hypothetical protein
MFYKLQDLVIWYIFVVNVHSFNIRRVVTVRNVNFGIFCLILFV